MLTYVGAVQLIADHITLLNDAGIKNALRTGDKMFLEAVTLVLKAATEGTRSRRQFDPKPCCADLQNMVAIVTPTKAGGAVGCGVCGRQIAVFNRDAELVEAVKDLHKEQPCP